MVFRRFLILSACLTLTGIFPAFPAAAQALTFRDAPSEAELFFINQYLGESNGPYAAASTDLNMDGMDELIVRSQACPAQSPCLYTILADADGQLLELGTIEAVRIARGQGSLDGVRDLIAYQNPGNDYAHNIYTWDSPSSRYKISE